MSSVGGRHFDFSMPGRPPYLGSGTSSLPSRRLRARLVTPRSGSWRAVFCAPRRARFDGVSPRPRARSARDFDIPRLPVSVIADATLLRGKTACSCPYFRWSRDEPHLGEPGSTALESCVRGPELDPADASQRDVEGVTGGETVS